MATKIIFPLNPPNGTIFEPVPGVFFQFDESTNSWIRLQGVGNLGLATPLADGLMSKDDLAKLEQLLLPPPQTSITGDQCALTFKAGRVGLRSEDESLNIETTLNVANPAANITNNPIPWDIHSATAGVNFRLDLDRFLQDIKNRGNIKEVQLSGLQGPKGDDGEDGRDRLDTGPVGEQGDAGTNVEFGGSLLTESAQFIPTNAGQNRAITDISVKETEDEYSLVVTRGLVGNPDACPSEIRPKDFESPWLLVLSDGVDIVTRKLTNTQDCSTVCKSCVSSVFYLNIQSIIDDLDVRFREKLAELKHAKEDLAAIWLRSMVQLFNDQKSALCCALENCRSRTRNQNERRYIEQSRIAAAVSDHSIVIDNAGVCDDSSNFVIIDMDPAKDCFILDANGNPIVGEPAITGVECKDCLIEMKLDSRVHNQDPRGIGVGVLNHSVSAFLPAGEYSAQITDCCAQYDTQFGGVPQMLILAPVPTPTGDDSVDPIEKVISFNDLGAFASEADAKNAYIGLTAAFNHAGGEIRVWLPDVRPNADRDGEITLCIQSRDCLDFNPTATSVDESPIFVYLNEIGGDNLIGIIKPFSGTISSVDNYNYQGTDDPNGPNIRIGPSAEINKMNLFFYSNPSGVDFFTTVSAIGGTSSTAQARYRVRNNPQGTCVLVSDDPAEVMAIESTDLPGADTSEDLLIQSFSFSGSTSGGSLSVQTTPEGFGSIDGARRITLDIDADISSGFFKVQLFHPVYKIVNTATEGPNPFGSVDPLPFDANYPDLIIVDALDQRRGIVMQSQVMALKNVSDGDPIDPFPFLTGSFYSFASAAHLGSTTFGFDVPEATISSPTEGVLIDSPILRDTAAQTSGIPAVFAGRMNGKVHWLEDDLWLSLQEKSQLLPWFEPRSSSDNVWLPFGVDLNQFPRRFTMPHTGEIIPITFTTEVAAAGISEGRMGEAIGISPAAKIPEVITFNQIVMPDAATIAATAANKFQLHLGVNPSQPLQVKIPFNLGRWGIGVTSKDPLSGLVNPANIVNATIEFHYDPTTQTVPIVVQDSSGMVSGAGLPCGDLFQADWVFNDEGDGIVLGSLSSGDNANWIVELSPTNLGSLDELSVFSGDGDKLNLKIDAGGIGDTLTDRKYIFTRFSSSCELSHRLIEWYERGWRIGANCGAYVIVDGMQFIVVKRSLGVDITCGGGESLSNPCLASFILNGDGHPAFAFATADGEEFIDKPRSGFRDYIRDDALSTQILTAIANGEAIETNGDPVTNIPFILFPSSGSDA